MSEGCIPEPRGAQSMSTIISILCRESCETIILRRDSQKHTLCQRASKPSKLGLVKKILVTGAGGQIGINLTQRLLTEGHTVLAIDNHSTSLKSQLSSLAASANLEIFQHDVGEPFPDLEGVQQIFHLAAPASPIHYLAKPLETMRTIQLGTQHALDVATKNRATILIASTSEIYGEPLVHPQPEGYWGNVDPIGIRSCYKEAKRFAESLAVNHSRELGTSVRIARIFNTYGPGAFPKDGRVVNEFVRAALSGKDLVLHASGKQTRSFCYVSDLVEGLIALADSDYDVSPVNLGNPAESSVAELARLVIEVTHSSSKLSFQPGRADDPSRRSPDISLAKKILGWSPKIDLREGIEFTANWMANRQCPSNSTNQL